MFVREMTDELPEQPEARGFDYAALDSETRIVVQQRTGEIKNLVRRNAQDIVDIGQKLAEVKEQLGHGSFMNWLKSEFNWSISAATRFMQVSEQFKFVNLVNLEIAASALYLLAAPSTPALAREEALERAAQGEAISHAKANAVVTRHKEAAKPKAPKPVTVDVPAETVVRDSSTPAEPRPAAQTVEAESAAVVEQSEDKLPEEETEVPAHFQVSNRSHDMAPAADSGDYLLKDQTEIDIQSLFGVGNLIYFADLGQQESKFLGEVAEVKEATATEVVIKISLCGSDRLGNGISSHLISRSSHSLVQVGKK